MRIVIIKDNGKVSVGGDSIENLDLSQCGLPDNFWALQWEERGVNSGHIEYDSPLIDNTQITELPTWALACVAVWQDAVTRRDAEESETDRQEQTPNV